MTQDARNIWYRAFVSAWKLRYFAKVAETRLNEVSIVIKLIKDVGYTVF